MSNVSASARRKARRFAMQAVYQWQLAGAEPSEIEAWFRSENDMRKADTVYFHELLFGVCAGVDELDDALTPALDRPVKELSQVEKSILRLGAFELIHRIDVPWKVVINEAIELAKVFGADDAHKYVNGVLDKVARRVRRAETGRGRSTPDA
jgi:N utilization substance protein B